MTSPPATATPAPAARAHGASDSTEPETASSSRRLRPWSARACSELRVGVDIMAPSACGRQLRGPTAIKIYLLCEDDKIYLHWRAGLARRVECDLRHKSPSSVDPQLVPSWLGLTRRAA